MSERKFFYVEGNKGRFLNLAHVIRTEQVEGEDNAIAVWMTDGPQPIYVSGQCASELVRHLSQETVNDYWFSRKS